MADTSKQPQTAIAEALPLLQTFRGADLTQTIYQIEKSVRGISAEKYAEVVSTSGAKAEVLGAAGLVKQLAGQINVVIHALGILLCLPHILRARAGDSERLEPQRKAAKQVQRQIRQSIPHGARLLSSPERTRGDTGCLVLCA
jgi:hypothetical protein